MKKVKTQIGHLPFGAIFLNEGMRYVVISHNTRPVKYARCKLYEETPDYYHQFTASDPERIVELVHPKYQYPKDSSEYLIHETLWPLIEKCKEMMYTDEFKTSPKYLKEETDLEVLGVIVSKFCKWEPSGIEAVSLAAFEDANYSQVEISY